MSNPINNPANELKLYPINVATNEPIANPIVKPSCEDHAAYLTGSKKEKEERIILPIVACLRNIIQITIFCILMEII